MPASKKRMARARASGKAGAGKPQTNVIMLLGTSSAGKSTVTSELTSARSDVQAVMADKVWDEVIHKLKYKLRRLTVANKRIVLHAGTVVATAERAMELSRTPGQCVIIDDIQTDVADKLREQGVALKLVLLYASLNALIERSRSRKGSDGRRALDSVLKSFTDLYTTKEQAGCKRVGSMKAGDVARFLKREPHSKINVEKVAAKALRQLGFRKDADSEEEEELYTRMPVDVVIDTDALDSAAVLKKVSEHLPPPPAGSRAAAAPARKRTRRAYVPKNKAAP